MDLAQLFRMNECVPFFRKVTPDASARDPVIALGITWSAILILLNLPVGSIKLKIVVASSYQSQLYIDTFEHLERLRVRKPTWTRPLH